jgi:hypothetical protein
MACKSCKKTQEEIASEVVSSTYKIEGKKIKDYVLNFFLFLVLATLLVPFIIPITLVVMFRIIVLDKSINLLPVVKYLGQKIFSDKEDNEEDEFEDDEALDIEEDDDYEPLNSHEIIDFNDVK